MEEKNIVVQTTREKAMAKVLAVSEENICNAAAVGKVNNLREVRRRFLYYFMNLSEKHLVLSEEQLKQFNKEELEELADVIASRVIFFSTLQFLCYLTIPIVGWLMPFCGEREFFYSLWFRHYRNILIAAYEKKYFPYTELISNDIWKPYRYRNYYRA